MNDPLPREVIDLGAGFFSLRGHLKLGGIVDIGTHAALVERANGKFVLLDACAFDGPTQRFIDQKTDEGERLEAVLHLHPFHTLHVRAVHERYPKAALYGTRRHAEKFADLPFDPLHTDEPALHQKFDDFDFTVPRGVDFISKDKKVHFSSVLAIHRRSRTLYVDDTLVMARLPLSDRYVTRFHPTLKKALEPRAESAQAFREWARELIDRARDLRHLAAAHRATLNGALVTKPSVVNAVEVALEKAESTLRAHERRKP